MRSACGDPTDQRAFPRLVEAGERVRHPPQRMVLREVLEVFGGRARLFAIEIEREALREVARGRQRLSAFQREHLQQEARARIALGPLGQDGVEALLPPALDAMRVDVEAGRRGRDEARAIVDLVAARSPRDPVERPELELAGCVIAAMAYDATGLEDVLRLRPYRRLLGGGQRKSLPGGGRSRRPAARQRNEDGGRKNAGEEA